jgi:hypothetical protein
VLLRDTHVALSILQFPRPPVPASAEAKLVPLLAGSMITSSTAWPTSRHVLCQELHCAPVLSTACPAFPDAPMQDKTRQDSAFGRPLSPPLLGKLLLSNTFSKPLPYFSTPSCLAGLFVERFCAHFRAQHLTGPGQHRLMRGQAASLHLADLFSASGACNSQTFTFC